jgi:hypothetical protein
MFLQLFLITESEFKIMKLVIQNTSSCNRAQSGDTQYLSSVQLARGSAALGRLGEQLSALLGGGEGLMAQSVNVFQRYW